MTLNFTVWTPEHTSHCPQPAICVCMQPLVVQVSVVQSSPSSQLVPALRFCVTPMTLNWMYEFPVVAPEARRTDRPPGADA